MRKKKKVRRWEGAKVESKAEVGMRNAEKKEGEKMRRCEGGRRNDSIFPIPNSFYLIP